MTATILALGLAGWVACGVAAVVLTQRRWGAPPFEPAYALACYATVILFGPITLIMAVTDEPDDTF